MKKYSFILAAMFAAVIASCNKSDITVVDNTHEPGIDNNAILVEFNAISIETKTAFTDPSGSSYPTLWTTNDESVKILQNVGGSPVSATVTPSMDKTTAKFTASLTSDGSGSYTFYAVSPASAFTSYASAYKNFNVTVSGNQTPSAKSVDESVMLIAGKSTTYSPDFPASVDIGFAHATAYGKLTLSNLGLGVGESIKTVKLTTASTKWTGSGFYYIEDYDTHSAGDLVPASTASKELIINTNSASDIWFACMPADLGGEEVTVLVTTNKYTYTRAITIPSTKKFEAGKIASFTVNMSAAVKEDAPAYSLIPVAGSDNGYATSEDIVVSGITWNVTGNVTMLPWRIGGKNLSGVDRAIYSKTAITNNISQIVITHGTASSVTVNSMKVYVCSSAAGAAKDTPTDVVASFTPTFVASNSVTVNKTDDTSWANCYYRIVYNLTIGGTNKYIQFSEAKFYE